MPSDERLADELDRRARDAVSLADAQRLALEAARLRRGARPADAQAGPALLLFRN